MLLSAVHAFAAAHAVDALPVVAVCAGVAFAWSWYFIAADIAPSVGLYWAVWPAGLALALALRAVTRRLGALTLWPDSLTSPRQACAPLLLTFAFTWYPRMIEDPASSLVSPFPIGAVVSLLAATVVLLCIEIADNIGGSGTAQAFLAFGVNATLWCGIAAIVALDVAVWMHGWLLVVLTAAALLTAAGVYRLSTALTDAHDHMQ